MNAIVLHNMKWIAIIMVLLCSVAKGQDLTFSISTDELQGKSFIKIVNHIESRYGIQFSYSTNVVSPNTIHYFSSSRNTISELLDQICEQQDISYLEVNEKILFVEKPADNTLPFERHIYGYIKDSETGEPLIGAAVFNQKTYTGTSTNNFGFYSTKILSLEDSIVFRYIGYQPLVIAATQLKNREDIALSPAMRIKEIIISPDESLKTRFPIQEQMVRLDHLSLGDNAVMNTLRDQPQVQSGSEVKSNLLVRGGGNEHNLVLMDGVSFYEPNHLLGISSIFNSESVSHIEFMPNNISAKYGGRLSSVINVDMKNGNLYNYKSNFKLGLLGSSFHIEGPLERGFSSFNFSARTSYVNYFINSIGQRLLDIEQTMFNYQDVYVKLHRKLTKNGSFFISGYYSRDRIGFSDQVFSYTDDISFELFTTDNRLNWRNQMINVQYKHIFGDQLFMNIGANVMDYKLFAQSYNEYVKYLPNTTERDTASIYSYSNIRDLTLKNDWQWYISNQHQLKFGGGMISHLYSPSIRERDILIEETFPSIVDSETQISAMEYYGYVEDNLIIGKKWKLRAGFHLSAFQTDDAEYFSFQPRAAISYTPNSYTSIQADYARLTQFVHLLFNPGVGLPMDLWVPSTSKIPPQNANHYTISFDHSWSTDLYMQGAIYYKQFENLIEYEYAYDQFNPVINTDKIPVFNDSRDWEDRVDVGEGYAYGFDVGVSYEFQNVKLTTGFGSSRSFRLFENINQGEWYPYTFDRPVDISLSGEYRFSEDFILSAKWIYGTGSWTSWPLTEFQSENGDVFLDFSERNNLRIPDYHRLDLKCNYNFDLFGFVPTELGVGIQNVYNRQNAYYIYLYDDPYEDRYIPKKVTAFPFLPHINLKIHIIK